MLLLPFFFCIVLISPYANTHDKNEIIDVAVEALMNASADATDLLLALSSFGEHAASLMKAIIPVIAMFMETPKHEEYDVMTDFLNQTEEIWRNNQRRYLIYQKGIHANLFDSEYYMEVDNHMINVNSLIHLYLPRRTDKNDELKFSFQEACLIGSKSSPRHKLNYLIIRLVDYCGQAVTPTEAQAITDHRDYLMKVFLRLRVRGQSLPDPGLYLSEFLIIYGSIAKYVLHDDLYVYHVRFSSYEKAVLAFFEELRSRSRIRMLYEQESCLSRALIYESNFNYPAIKAFVTKLKNQLVHFTYYASVCAEVLHHGDVTSLDIYTKQIVEEVTLISSFTSKFLNDSLISAWPSAHNQILKEQIMQTVHSLEMKKRSQSGNGDRRTSAIVADHTHPLLINTGVPNYVYEMMIVKASEQDYEHFFDGIDSYCSFKKRQSGYDTVIGRVPLNTGNEEEKFEVEGKMLRKKNDITEMNITIQYEMDELYDVATLPLIADTLKKKIGKEFITEQDFHCWGIVRQWSAHIWSSCPTIDHWSSSFNYSDLSSITTLSYENSGYVTEVCEVFQFYFFV